MKGTCLVLAAAAGAFVSPSAVATFHFMQIEQVIGGVNGDPSAQAIQLRTRTAHQNLVLQARMVVVDAMGANPVEIIDFTTNAPNPAAGARILITSPNFIDALDGPLAPDFTMTTRTAR